MANVTREFVIKVNSKGQVEAIRDFEKLDKTMKQTAKSVGQTDRAMKGVAQATSNSSKEFAKQAQGLGGIVRIYATVAANVFALSSAYNVLKRNADLEILRTSSRQLSVTTGQDFASIADSIKKVTGGAIGFREAFQSANLALSGGLSGTQATQIAEIATKAANALGRSVPEAVQRLTQAIVKAEPELADEFGIVLRVTEATNKYAKALGILPTELSTAQKQQAIFNQFLEQGTEKFANVQIQTNPYDKLAASFLDITNKVTELIRVPLDPFINLISSNGLILLGIFGAIAAKLTSLAIPALREFTTELAENSAAYSTKAAADYVKAQERVSKANFAAAQSFEDYTSILQNGLKGIDFSTLKNSKIEVDFLDPDALGKDFSNSFKKAFKKSDVEILKFRDSVQKKLDGAVKGSIIDVQGLKLNTSQAKILVEALSVSTTRGAAAAEAAFQREIGSVKRLGLEFDQVRAKAAAFSAQLKAATAGQFSIGLAGGFIDNLKELPALFSNNVKAAEGFSSKFAGALGVGARATGTLVGGVTKLLGVLGPLGLAFSFAVSFLGEFTDLLGITSKAAGEAAKGLKEVEENQKLLNDQVVFNNSISTNSFDGYLKQIKNASNLTNGFIGSLTKLTTVLKNLEKANRESLFSFGNASDVEDVLTKVLENIKLQAKTIPEAFREEFENTVRNIEVDLSSAIGYDNLSSKLSILGDKLDGLDFIEVIRTGGSANVAKSIKFKAELTEANKKQLSKTIAELFDPKESERLIATIGAALEQAFQNGKEKVIEINDELQNVANTLDTFNNFATGEIRKLERKNPLIQQLDNLDKALNERRKTENQQFGLAESPLPLETRALLDIDEDTSRDYEAVGVVISDLRDKLVAAEAAQESFKSSQKSTNLLLREFRDEYRRGDLGALREEYRVRREGLQEELNVQDQLIAAAERRVATQKRIGSTQVDVAQAELDALKDQKRSLEGQKELYSEVNAEKLLSVERSKATVKAAGRVLNTIQAQARVYDQIFSATGNVTDLEKRAVFEEKILQAKLAQVRAQKELKIAEAANARGTRRAQLLAEASALSAQLEIEKDLFVLRQVSAAAESREKQLAEEKRELDTISFIEKTRLETAQALADLASSNNFLSNQQRDQAEINSLVFAREIAERNVADIQDKQALTAKAIANEQARIKDLQAKGLLDENSTLELRNLQAEARRLDLELTREQATVLEEQLKIREKDFELAKKTANLFKDPKQFTALLGETFRRSAEEFGEKIGDSVQKTADILLGSVDAGIDAFVDAVRNGEDALRAATTAIGDTFLELNNQFIKDVFKKTARDILAGITGNKNFGKSEELIEAQKQTRLLEQIATQGVTSSSVVSDNSEKEQKTLFNKIGEFTKSTFSKIKETFSGTANTIEEASTTAFSGIKDLFADIDIGGIFSSLQSGLSSLFNSFTGGIGGGSTSSDVASLVQTGISLFFAKGGVTGEIMKRIPMYATGGVTSGPEIAMVGEGPKKEAIVPLPDNRSIPVTINGNPEGTKNVSNNINISITGVQGTEEGLRRSANQIALQVAREQQRAQGRIG